MTTYQDLPPAIRVITEWRGTGAERVKARTHYVNAPDGRLATWYVAGKLRLKLEDWHGLNPPYILRDEGILKTRKDSHG